MKIFLLDEECVGRKEFAEKKANVSGEIRIVLVGLCFCHFVPSGTEITTQDISQVGIAVSIVDVQAVIVTSIQKLVDDADETFLVGGIWAQKQVLGASGINSNGTGGCWRDDVGVGDTNFWVVFIG
jgi:hypothetical protein